MERLAERAGRLLDWATARPRRPLLIAGLLLLAVGSGLVMVRRAHKRSSDFPMTLEFGEKLLGQRENVYETQGAAGTHTKYPPFFFVLTRPLGLGSLTLGAVLWHLLALLGVAVIAWCAVAAVQPVGSDPPALGPVLAPLALGLPMVLTNLHLGQSNLLVLALVAVGLYLASRGRQVRSGAALAIGVALKLTPALLVAGFAWKRAGRLLLGAALALAICWALLPAAVFGPTRAAQVTRSWSRVVAGFVERGAGAESAGHDDFGYRQTNQSLDAAVRRFLADIPAVRAEDGRRELRVNALSLDARTLDWIVRGLDAALLLALLWLARGALGATSRLALGLEVSLALIVMLAVAPITWDSYFVALLMPYAVALETLRRRPRGDALRRWLLRALCLCVLLTVAGLSPYARAYSVLLLGALLLGAALAAARVVLRREAAST